MQFVEYPDRDRLMSDLAEQLARALRAALRVHDRISFCVPGGSTPGPLFDRLARVDLNWERVAVFLSDERWVAGEDPRSNSALLRNRLLVGQAAAATLIPMFGATQTPEESIDMLSDGLRAHLPINVLLLGMGADMHTASLFPGGDQLAAALAPDAPILVPMRAAHLSEARVSLSAPVLAAAFETHLVITGDEKRLALERARGLSPTEAPIATVLEGATVHWAASS